MLVGAFQALIVAAAAFSWKTDNRPAARTFGGIMMLWALIMFAAARSELGSIPPDKVPYWFLHARGALGLLLGPLVFFHVRTSVDDGYRLLRLPRLVHLIPPAIHLSLLLPFLFVEPELRQTFEDVYRARELYRSAIPGIRVGFIITSLYVLGSYFWIRRFEAHAMDVASFGDESHVRWLKIFILLLLSLLFVLGFATLGEPIQFMAAVTMVAFVNTITFIGLARPKLFHAIPQSLRLHSPVADEEKYVASPLEETQKEEFLKRLTTYFDNEQPFLKQELTLRQVAEQINIPYRYVSQIINEKTDSHFMDFVNGYRIEAAKARLTDPHSAHLSIDGIADEAGFKSRSAFYAAFKKTTGETPGAYRRKSLSR